MFPHFWFLFLGGDFGVGYFRLLFVCWFFLLCAHPSYRRQLTVVREKLCTYIQPGNTHNVCSPCTAGREDTFECDCGYALTGLWREGDPSYTYIYVYVSRCRPINIRLFKWTSGKRALLCAGEEKASSWCIQRTKPRTTGSSQHHHQQLNLKLTQGPSPKE